MKVLAPQLGLLARKTARGKNIVVTKPRSMPMLVPCMSALFWRAESHTLSCHAAAFDPGVIDPVRVAVPESMQRAVENYLQTHTATACYDQTADHPPQPEIGGRRDDVTSWFLLTCCAGVPYSPSNCALSRLICPVILLSCLHVSRTQRPLLQMSRDVDLRRAGCLSVSRCRSG